MNVYIGPTTFWGNPVNRMMHTDRLMHNPTQSHSGRLTSSCTVYGHWADTNKVDEDDDNLFASQRQ